MVAPLSEDEKLFCRRFWHLQNPESRILAPSSEEPAPCWKVPGATPASYRSAKRHFDFMKYSFYYQWRRGTCRVGVGGRIQRFSVKIQTFIFTNSKITKIFRRSIKIPDNRTISKKLEGPWHLPPPGHDAQVLHSKSSTDSQLAVILYSLQKLCSMVA